MSDHDALSRLYRQLPPDEPPAHFDAQVLAAVNAELEAERERRARRQRRWRYHVPLATAATLVLAVALLLSQPGSRQELLSNSPVMAPETAYEMSNAREKRAGIAADNTGPVQELRVLVPPPPPAPVPVPPPVIESPAMAAAPMASPVMGFVADRALKQASELEMLLKEAPGMAAPEFCTRLRALWAATEATGEATGEAAPECPTTDGNHEWPAPLPMAWQVNTGLVQKAELRR